MKERAEKAEQHQRKEHKEKLKVANAEFEADQAREEAQQAEIERREARREAKDAKGEAQQAEIERKEARLEAKDAKNDITQLKLELDTANQTIETQKENISNYLEEIKSFRRDSETNEQALFTALTELGKLKIRLEEKKTKASPKVSKVYESSVDKISREEKATVNHIQMKRWRNGGTIFYCSEWNPRLGMCICKPEYVDDIKKCGNNPSLKAKPPVVPKTVDDAEATLPQPPQLAKGGTLRKKKIQKNKNIYKTLGKKLSLNPSLKKKIIKKYRKQLSYKKKYHDLKKQLTNLLD